MASGHERLLPNWPCTLSGAGLSRAVQYLQQAGENAVRRSAHQEAISHLTKGLELLKTLPDTPERTQQELTLQLALGLPLIATKGYAAPEVEKPMPGPGNCASRWGDSPALPGAVWTVVFYLNPGGVTRQRVSWRSSCCGLAQSVQDPSLLS